MKVLLGKKIGMTEVFNKENGKLTPVTVVDVSNNVVAKHLKNGEEVTHIEVGYGKQKNSRKVDLGNYKNLKYVPQFKRAFKISNKEDIIEEASELKADVFVEGDLVDVTGVSKGKGFQGVMKRWNFKGGKRTHGQSDRERAPGSIGSGTTPGRVVKGKKMPGRMGRDQKTIQNVKIMDIDVDNNLVAVSGSLPGMNGAFVVIKQAKKSKQY